MRYIPFCLATVIATGPLNAQELALFETWALPGLPSGKVERGPGLSVTGTARLGTIMAKMGPLSRSNLRVGARVALSRFDSRMLDYSRYIDDCPPGAHDVWVPLRIYHGSLLAYPYRTSSTRFELGTGIAAYAYPGNNHQNSWGFTGGIALSRRAPVSLPVWVTVGYEAHTPSFVSKARDYLRTAPPRQTVRFGLAYQL